MHCSGYGGLRQTSADGSTGIERSGVYVMTSVLDIMKLRSFTGARAVAGERGMGAQVEDISIMEVPDIEDYVSEGDFLLTTLYPIADDLAQFKNFVTRMKRMGLSGVGIKLNRYVSSLPQSGLEEADNLDFPILLLPGSANFSHMINDFLKITLEKKNNELEHRNHIQEMLMEILLQGGKPRILAKSLSENLGLSVALYGSEAQRMAEYATPDAQNVSRDEVDALVRSATFGSPLIDYHRLSVGYAAVHMVHFGKRTIGGIVVFSEGEFAIEGYDSITFQQYTVAFRVIVQQMIMDEDALRNRRALFASDFLFGVIDNEELAVEQASLLGWELTFPVDIFMILVPPEERSADNRHELLDRIERRIKSRAGGDGELSPVFISESRSRIIIMIAGGSDDGAIPKLLDVILESFSMEEIGKYYVSQSRTVTSLPDIKRVFDECEYTLSLQQQLKSYGHVRFQDLGVYRVIYGVDDKEELKSFCIDTIGPLIDYDRQHEGCLMETIFVFLDCGNNLKRTAGLLSVHYNTVRYRCHLAESLLGVSFDNAGECQAVTLALKAYRALWSD